MPNVCWFQFLKLGLGCESRNDAHKPFPPLFIYVNVPPPSGYTNKEAAFFHTYKVRFRNSSSHVYMSKNALKNCDWHNFQIIFRHLSVGTNKPILYLSFKCFESVVWFWLIQAYPQEWYVFVYSTNSWPHHVFNYRWSVQLNFVSLLACFLSTQHIWLSLATVKTFQPVKLVIVILFLFQLLCVASKRELDKYVLVFYDMCVKTVFIFFKSFLWFHRKFYNKHKGLISLCFHPNPRSHINFCKYNNSGNFLCTHIRLYT